MRLPLVIFSVVMLGVGCSSASKNGDATQREIKEFDSADAARVVAERTKAGNWKFLGWSGGAVEESYVPGLSKEEVKHFIDSGKFGWEAFHYYHGEFFYLESDHDHKALLDAKRRYAERVNRSLIDAIKKKEANQAPEPTAPSGRGSS